MDLGRRRLIQRRLSSRCSAFRREYPTRAYERLILAFATIGLRVHADASEWQLHVYSEMVRGALCQHRAEDAVRAIAERTDAQRQDAPPRLAWYYDARRDHADLLVAESFLGYLPSLN